MILKSPVTGIDFISRRRVAGIIRPLLLSGVGSRMLLGKLRSIYCLLTCKGEEVESFVSIPDSRITIREPQYMSKKTYVTNTGSATMKIWEDGVLIRLLVPGQTYTTPLSGRLKLEGQAIGGASTSALITTHRRCECNHPHHSYGDASEPIGGVILY